MVVVSERAIDPVVRRIARALSGRREIAAAYVFGSVATGQVRPDSDVDVAVLLGKAIGPTQALNYRLRLMSELGSALRRSDVDVVILNLAPPLLAHRVLSKGRLILERSAAARVRFQVRTASRYADLIPSYETHIEYLKRQVREERPRG